MEGAGSAFRRAGWALAFILAAVATLAYVSVARAQTPADAQYGGGEAGAVLATGVDSSKNAPAASSVGSASSSGQIAASGVSGAGSTENGAQGSSGGTSAGAATGGDAASEDGGLVTGLLPATGGSLSLFVGIVTLALLGGAGLALRKAGTR